LNLQQLFAFFVNNKVTFYRLYIFPSASFLRWNPQKPTKQDGNGTTILSPTMHTTERTLAFPDPLYR